MKHFLSLTTFLLVSNILFSVQPAKPFDAVVSKEGPSDHQTIQAAIDAAPVQSSRPYRILVEEGLYEEHVEVPANKPNICLIGTHPEKVLIGENTCCGTPDRKFKGRMIRSGTAVEIYADDFHAENITFVNLWGYEHKTGPQALAMNSFADRLSLVNCRLLSYQDTYLTSTRKPTDRHYLKNCYIEGAVDFIYGSGNVLFDSCTIGINRQSGGYIVAPNHSPVVPWGYVFLNCRIVPCQDSTNVWLGRPWHETPKTVFINTVSEVEIRSTGWLEKMGGLPAVFAEFNTMDAQGKPIDLSQRRTRYWKWKDAGQTEKITSEAKSILTEKEAACYTPANVLRGGDNWQPEKLVNCLPDPVLTVKNGRCSWKKVHDAIGYMVFVNRKKIGFTSGTSMACHVDKSDQVVVRSLNASGGFTPAF